MVIKVCDKVVRCKAIYDETERVTVPEQTRSQSFPVGVFSVLFGKRGLERARGVGAKEIIPFTPVPVPLVPV